MRTILGVLVLLVLVTSCGVKSSGYTASRFTQHQEQRIGSGTTKQPMRVFKINNQ